MGVIAFAGVDFVAVLLGSDLDFPESSIPVLVLRVVPEAGDVYGHNAANDPDCIPIVRKLLNQTKSMTVNRLAQSGVFGGQRK
jgi:hypothetical protein